jgi:sterol 14-demethylase
MVLLLLWAPVLLSLASSPFREAVEQGAAASLAYAVASPAHAMLAASAALAALATLMGGLWALRWLCRAADPKAPPVYTTGLPLVGSFLSFTKDQLGTVRQARAATKSDVFTIQPLGTFLIGADAHKPFFESFDEELDQAPVYKFMIPIFGKGVVYDAPIRKRRQQYRVLGSSLRPNMLKRYPEIIARECRQFYRAHLGVTPGAAVSVDILHKFADLTILTASAALHGREVRENLFEDVSRLFAKMDAGLTPLSVIAPYLPTPAHRARDHAHSEMVALFSKVINARRAAGKAPEGSVDMLQKLIDAEYKEGGKLPANEIAGLLIAALFAGQHTSSITSSWTLMFLLEDRRKGGKWLDRVLQEIDEMETAHGSGTGAFARAEPGCVEKVFDMNVLYACVKEAVRMYPPLMFLMRQVCSKPLKVCGYEVPVGSRVWVSTAVSQRLPEVFRNPDTFDPGRWLGEGENGFDIRKLPPYSYIGFGAGIHTCMGESFAFLQIRTILAVLLSTYDVEMPGKFPQADYDAMVVMPKGKNPIVFTPRSDYEDRMRAREGLAQTGAGVAGADNVGDLKKIASQTEGSTMAAGRKNATTSHRASSYSSAAETGRATAGDGNAFSGMTTATYTMHEVARHDNRDDLWIVVEVDGVRGVYDVTTYLPVHQGGDALLKWAGKDATEAVAGPQHPSTVWRLLTRYKIGEVREEAQEETFTLEELDSLL